ncbi:hypothetical protein ACHAXH_000462 [Discostella pseudostelligera]
MATAQDWGRGVQLTMTLASVTVMTESRLYHFFTASSMKNVCTTGAGSASPVVSMITPSVCRRMKQKLPLESLYKISTYSATDAAVQYLYDLFINLLR